MNKSKKVTFVEVEAVVTPTGKKADGPKRNGKENQINHLQVNIPSSSEQFAKMNKTMVECGGNEAVLTPAIKKAGRAGKLNKTVQFGEYEAVLTLATKKAGRQKGGKGARNQENETIQFGEYEAVVTPAPKKAVRQQSGKGARGQENETVQFGEYKAVLTPGPKRAGKPKSGKGARGQENEVEVKEKKGVATPAIKSAARPKTGKGKENRIPTPQFKYRLAKMEKIEKVKVVEGEGVVVTSAKKAGRPKKGEIREKKFQEYVPMRRLRSHTAPSRGEITTAVSAPEKSAIPKMNGSLAKAPEKPAPKTRGRKPAAPAVKKPKEDTISKRAASAEPAPGPSGLRKKRCGSATATTFAAPSDGLRLKVVSWNVDGLRALVTKDGLALLLGFEADIICLQEVRCTYEEMPQEVDKLEEVGYTRHFLPSPNASGFAGCVVWSKLKALKVTMGIGDFDLDLEGRMITIEYENFYLVNVFVPNSGRKLLGIDKRLKWNRLFVNHIQTLDALKPVVIAGDMNVCHHDIDMANPAGSITNAGFSEVERKAMTEFLELGFVDTYRKLHPTKTGAYTFFSYVQGTRKNVGWRLDYILVSARIADDVSDSDILKEIRASDHCPIAMKFRIGY